MTRRLAFLGLAALLTAVPAYSQGVGLPCGGSVSTPNQSSQLGQNLWLAYSVGTSVPFNVCVVGVMVDAHVAGKPGSGLHRDGIWTATAQRQIPVDYPGIWVTLGAHAYWLAGLPLPRLIPAGLTQSAALVEAYRSPAEQCAAQGWDYYWNGFECVYSPGSPIIVDTGGKGYHLTSLEDGVLFDLDGDGQVENVSWTRGDAENAFLAFDRNGNGTIDDGTELFGSYTPAFPGRDLRITAPNGFEALRFAESPSYGATRVGDGLLDARDTIFARLLLWTDRNHNGISEPEELQAAAEAGVVSIGTDYKTIGRVDRFGNQFRQKGRLTWADGEDANVYDVWLKIRR